MMLRVSLILPPVLGVIWLAAGVAYYGSLAPGYDHLADFMSVLGAVGMPHGGRVNVLVFMGAEVWVLLFVVLAWRRTGPGTPVIHTGLVLIALFACLLIVAAAFPCDFGCRPAAPPSTSHVIHMGAGLAAYVCGLAGLSLASTGLRRQRQQRFPGVWRAAALSTGLLLVIGVSGSGSLAGLYQRLLEALLYVWMAVLGYALDRHGVDPLQVRPG